jgi:predicted acetyltransferase
MGTVRDIKVSEFDACLDLWDKAFERTPREYFVKYFLGDPHFKPQYTRVCADGDELQSCVQIVRRVVRIGKSRLVMGGIANVGTPVEYRGRGYSTDCMNSAVEVMDSEGFDFSILYTGINPFYEKLGWETVPVDALTGELRNPMPRTDGDYTIRQYDPEKDAAAVVDIYNAFSKDIVLSAERTLDYWNGYCEVEPQRIRVAETSDGNLAGYAITASYRTITGICEIAYLPGHEGCVIPLFVELGRMMLDSGKTVGGAMLPDTPVISAGLDAILSTHQTETLTSAMFRVINLEQMMEKMLPELSARAADAGVEGSVAFTVIDANCINTALGTAGISISNGKASLTDPAKCEKNYTLSQTAFFQLIFGMKTPEEIIPEATPLIKALFPKLPNTFWLADHF